MINPISTGDAWLYSVLSDATLSAMLDTPPATIGGKSIYFDAVPQEVQATDSPVVIVRHKPSREFDLMRGNAGRVIAVTLRYQIVLNATVRGYAALKAADDRIAELLDLEHSSASDILKMEMLAPYRRAYVDGNKTFREVGADWLMQVSEYA